MSRIENRRPRLAAFIAAVFTLFMGAMSLTAEAVTLLLDSDDPPVQGAAPNVGPPTGLPAAADGDGDGIADNLQDKLAGAAAEALFDVIVTFTGPSTAATAMAAVGPFQIHTEFNIIDGFHATMTAGQVEALSGVRGVFRIEENAKLSVHLDASNLDFGAFDARLSLALGGFDVDGTGVGICFTDSGVYAEHEQFDDPGKIVGFCDATAIHRGPAGKNDEWGAGAIDAYVAVATAAGQPGLTPTSLPLYSRIEGESVADNSHRFIPIEIPDTSTPASITVTITSGQVETRLFGLATGWFPDLDAVLRDPNGVIVADSGCPGAPGDGGCGPFGRQETLSFMPSKTGTYTLDVFGFQDEVNQGEDGTFDIDISHGDVPISVEIRVAGIAG